MANGNDLDGQRHRSPGAVGAPNLRSLMGEPRKRFVPQYANLQEVLQAALARQRPAQYTEQYTDDDDADDNSPAETSREASLEDRLREVLGDGVVDDMEQHGRTSLALSNWLHATGVKRYAAAKTLSLMVAEHLNSMDLLDRIQREVESIG
jgi:hypothetical protein